MIISHNLYAMDSYNRLNVNIVGVQKSSEKLMSGYRINCAADDAAGLAMAEKMRSQIRGLAQATRNAQDGINFVQTAEGALGDMHTVLQRCKELATESANGTYSDDIDRDAVQLEIDQLRNEVEHIAMTDFNGRHCFEVDGSRFLPAYDHAKKSIGFAVQGGVSSPHEAKVTAALLTVGLDNGEKMCIDIEFDEVTFSNLDEEINNVKGKYGNSHGAVESFAEKIKNPIVPGILAGIAKKLPGIVSKRTGDRVQIGFHLYNDASDGVLASVSSGFSDGEQFFTLSINMNTIEADKYNTILISPELLSTIAHEMTHAVMFDTTTSGMGFNGDSLPLWFIEGAAETVGGGMDRLWELLPRKDGGTPSAPASLETIKNWTKKLGDGSRMSPYEQGYAATMYLSWLAGGGADNSSAPIDSNTIARGLDKILVEINGGKSFSQVIDELTGTKYKGLNDFVGKINAGDDDIADFLQDLITQTNAGIVTVGGESKVDVGGSIITPAGLNAPESNLDDLIGSGQNWYFEVELENNPGDPVPGTKLEGGGGNKNNKGDSYVEGSADPNTPTDSYNVFIDNLTPLNPFVLQVGARSKDDVQFTFDYSSSGIGDLKSDMNCTGQGLGLNDISVITQSSANEAIDKLDFAINKVSLMRATYGTIGSRLIHKIDDLTETYENLSEAESHISDTDMAEEMMLYTRGQILRRSSQSMLTHANQIPRGALQLFS